MEGGFSNPWSLKSDSPHPHSSGPMVCVRDVLVISRTPRAHGIRHATGAVGNEARGDVNVLGLERDQPSSEGGSKVEELTDRAALLPLPS